MYLPRIPYPSSSDFGHLSSPLDHSSAAGRRLTEYRSPCEPEPRQQCRPPWEWSLFQANRPIAPPSPTCYNLDAAQQSLHPAFNSGDGLLYGHPGFQRGLAGEPRRVLDRYPAFTSDSRLLTGNRVLPPVFDQFAEFAERGDPTSEVQKKDAVLDKCQNGERSEVIAGKDSPRAAEDEEEVGEAPSTRSCRDNATPGESFKT